MIPERNYLRAMLPSILGEGKIGLVKTSHGFMNLPQRLNHSVSTVMIATEQPSFVPFSRAFRSLADPPHLAATLAPASSFAVPPSSRLEASPPIRGSRTVNARLSSKDEATELPRLTRYYSGSWPSLPTTASSTP